jgi:hypothetical protein
VSRSVPIPRCSSDQRTEKASDQPSVIPDKSFGNDRS